MSVSENFDRKFNKSMRGYNVDEVDAALDALLRYCDELEDANREFEIANNDLIDEKTELSKNIDEAKSEIDSLKAKISEMQERSDNIERLYNSYREKFGEAKDMLMKAKTASSEIITRAETKAEVIAEEAEKAHKNQLEQFDLEIEKRRTLIEQLDICYNAFNKSLLEELKDMMGRIESFATMPAMPKDLPEKRPSIDASELVAFEKSEEEKDEEFLARELNSSAKEEEPFQYEDEIEEINDPVMTPYNFEQEDKEDLHQETAKPQTKMGAMKDTLDNINKKVSEKKTTSYI